MPTSPGKTHLGHTILLALDFSSVGMSRGLLSPASGASNWQLHEPEGQVLIRAFPRNLQISWTGKNEWNTNYLLMGCHNSSDIILYS